MRSLALGLCLLSFSAFAEAGLPPAPCDKSSCACGANTCVCGEPCSGSTCQPSTARFCSTDAACALSCASFVCDNNKCVMGMLPDGGANTPVPPMVMPVTPMTPLRGCGCNTGVGPALLFALLALRPRAARRA